EKVLAKDAREQMVILHLDEAAVTASNADATGGEPIFKDGKGVGRVTSGTYGYTVGMSLALAMVKGVGAGDEVDVMVLGQPHKAMILHEPPFDPKGEKLRA
ncbi:MAG: glycine cleavage T C-terminal barrel domain-containing protein, partial [Paracoccaceae bacterium]